MPLPISPLSQLLPLLLPHVEGCPAPLAVQNLRLAAVEFCERTSVWREEFHLTFDEQNEVIPPLGYAEIHKIESADFLTADGSTHALIPVPFYQTTPGDRDETMEAGAPAYITQIAPDRVTLVPFVAGYVIIQAIMKPETLPRYGVVSGTMTRQSIQNVIPTFIATKFGEVIARGALYRLMSMPRAPWSEPNHSAALYTLFDAACEANSNLLGQQRAPMHTRSSWV